MLTLIADHPAFVLINKPPGLACHRDRDGEPAVLDVLRAQTGIADLHLVHRLDKLTSGLLLVAKGDEAAAALSARFADRRMQKYYLALSDKAPKKKQGTLAGDMVKGRNGSWRLLADRLDPAVTQFFSAGLGGGRRLFLVKPLTGRTHQIRVALKALGSPILGDARYGGAASDRGYLHAYALAFDLQGEAFRFICPPSEGAHWPAALGDFADPLSQPWPRYGSQGA
jgi:tRNA pseudouridine32 synthase/23S rRNA pseudouridine746 synthase